MVVNGGLESDSAVVSDCLVVIFLLLAIHNFSPTFLNRLPTRESVLIYNVLINDEVYTAEYTLSEFNFAIHGFKATSPGTDRVHYIF